MLRAAREQRKEEGEVSSSEDSEERCKLFLNFGTWPSFCCPRWRCRRERREAGVGVSESLPRVSCAATARRWSSVGLAARSFDALSCNEPLSSWPFVDARKAQALTTLRLLMGEAKESSRRWRTTRSFASGTDGRSARRHSFSREDHSASSLSSSPSSPAPDSFVTAGATTPATFFGEFSGGGTQSDPTATSDGWRTRAVVPQQARHEWALRFSEREWTISFIGDRSQCPREFAVAPALHESFSDKRGARRRRANRSEIQRNFRRISWLRHEAILITD